jgi:NTE family protein
MPAEPAKPAISRDPILVDLALQGGGSHGAFTWGVLDRLLEEPWLGIDGISGTSAGAMNAAVLVDSHAKGGAARRIRRWFPRPVVCTILNSEFGAA